MSDTITKSLILSLENLSKDGRDVVPTCLGVYGKHYGVCKFLHYKPQVSLFLEICQYSKQWSGGKVYPIKGGERLYYRNQEAGMWEGTNYSKCRWDMIEFVLWWLKAPFYLKLWYKFTGEMK